MNFKCNATKCTHNKDNSCLREVVEINLFTDEYEQACCSGYEESIESKRNYYTIQKLEYSIMGYDYIVFGNSYLGCMDFLEDILNDIQDLEENNCSVKVIFDSLLHNGNSSDRYIELEYDCMFKRYKNDSIKIADINKKHLIREISMEYFKNNVGLVNNSILTSVQKKMILNGIAI